jgi:hypothetical protein
MIRRRQFIAGLGSAAAWPLAARAQQPARMRRIGMLNAYDENNQFFRSLAAHTFQVLSQMGWESGRNVQIIERWTGGDINRAGALAKELVALLPDVILAAGTPAAAALQRESSTIPVVFVVVTDPDSRGRSCRERAATGGQYHRVQQYRGDVRRQIALAPQDDCPSHHAGGSHVQPRHRARPRLVSPGLVRGRRPSAGDRADHGAGAQ